MIRAHVFTRNVDKPGHFTPRIEFDVLSKYDTDAAALVWIGIELNRGEESVGELYRSRNLPPIGVGDLIVLDRERWWVCEEAGWVACERPETVKDENEYQTAGRVLKRKGI